ncbi:hypothetical protein [Altererythrobacter sp. TH136]|uniref:hypothetical protein n=1 Tax=Altererythrobacter sp. TH136 TaxID=2067415 RepID=UPI001164A6A2|nr:hypothetical protein [Altererythrobacter sp. TH136]QDM40023.1 hypothetical protein C0V74_02390 [Altererythrobacter sp. TH136]
MRSCLVAAVLGLAACSQGEAQPQASPGARQIECAQGSGSAFAADCLVERFAGEEGSEFVVRHPDGAFRRFRIAQDRTSMVAIDGADDAVSTLVGDPPVMEVAVGPDRYRFPADIDAQP